VTYTMKTAISNTVPNQIWLVLPLLTH
jgi:hypothetical protein